MKTLQLFKDGKEILGSDGIMYVDGRLNPGNVKREVIERNKHYKKNYPHRLADAFAAYTGRIGGNMGRIVNLCMVFALLVGLTSCSKQANDLPQPKQPITVEYSVDCPACAVYFEDNVFNRNNGTDTRNEQYQVIHGSWTTTFKADTAFKTASLRIYVSVFAPDQSVHVRITTSDNKAIDKTLTLGADNNAASFELPLQ